MRVKGVKTAASNPGKRGCMRTSRVTSTGKRPSLTCFLPDSSDFLSSSKEGIKERTTRNGRDEEDMKGIKDCMRQQRRSIRSSRGDRRRRDFEGSH